MTPQQFREIVRQNLAVAAVLDRLPELRLAQGHLTAGCLFQTAWNIAGGRAPGWGIRDADVFYFDEDPSWEAEDAVIRRAAALCADMPLRVEVRNQARVHLWYEARFGAPCPPLRSAREGIDRFLVACTAVGVAVGTGEVYAPFGLDEIERGILRINPRHPRPALFRAKAEDYRARWPWLRIVEER